MRILLRLFSPLLGLAMAMAGGLLAVEAGWALARPGAGALLVPWPHWRDGLSTYSWSDTPVLAAGAALAGLGLLLLLLAGRARRHDVALTSPADEVTVVTSPRSLARAVGQRVREEDGVHSASVTVGARSVRVRAGSRLRSEAELHAALTARIGGLLADLPLTRTPRLRVVVTAARNRR